MVFVAWLGLRASPHSGGLGAASARLAPWSCSWAKDLAAAKNQRGIPRSLIFSFCSECGGRVRDQLGMCEFTGPDCAGQFEKHRVLLGFLWRVYDIYIYTYVVSASLKRHVAPPMLTRQWPEEVGDFACQCTCDGKQP